MIHRMLLNAPNPAVGEHLPPCSQAPGSISQRRQSQDTPLSQLLWRAGESHCRGISGHDTPQVPAQAGPGCWCHSLGDGLVAVPDGLQEPVARLLVLGSAAQPVPLLLQRRHLHTQQRHLWAQRGCESQGCSGKCIVSVCGGGKATWARLRDPPIVKKLCLLRGAVSASATLHEMC